MKRIYLDTTQIHDSLADIGFFVSDFARLDIALDQTGASHARGRRVSRRSRNVFVPHPFGAANRVNGAD